MKITVKNFLLQADRKKVLYWRMEEFKRTGEKVNQFYKDLKEHEEIVKWIDTVETINVKFFIGYRRYFAEVYKVGKSYFEHGQKMTKKNGYRSIVELAEITAEQHQEMTEDLYYY